MFAHVQPKGWISTKLEVLVGSFVIWVDLFGSVAPGLGEIRQGFGACFGCEHRCGKITSTWGKSTFLVNSTFLLFMKSFFELNMSGGFSIP